jgi:hypothetical protein
MGIAEAVNNFQTEGRSYCRYLLLWIKHLVQLKLDL